jgi:hypothetical protein
MEMGWSTPARWPTGARWAGAALARPRLRFQRRYLPLPAQSKLQPIASCSSEIPIQVAVPAPFAQTVSDNYSGVWLDTIWGHSWRRTKVSQSIFTGNTMSVSGLGRGSYVYLWERNGYNTATNANYTNIEYVVLNQTANLIKGIQKLTQSDQSATSTIKVDARYPTLATAPNGTVGIVWTENRLNQLTGKKLTNIYFALMNGQGQVIHGPANLTGSSEWLDTSLYRSPVIAATGDNRFTIVLVEDNPGGHNRADRLDLFQLRRLARISTGSFP